MLKKYIFKMMLLAACVSIIVGCGSQEEDTSFAISTELANQVGELMASVDESYGSTGSVLSVDQAQDQSLLNNEFLFLEKFSPEPLSSAVVRKFIPAAQAASCFGQAYSACSSNATTRTFGGCTLGAATFTGNVTMTWPNSGNTCAEVGGANIVRRNPNFTVTRGTATLGVSKSGTNGQEMSWTQGTNPKTVTYTSDGIRRTVSLEGAVVYDVTTTTVGSIVMSGTARIGRRIQSGTLRFTNNLTNEVCDITPTNVVWSSNCTCATAGSWSGNCSANGAFNVTISSCGVGSVTYNGQSRSVTFDRCSGS